jgi:5-methylcytosine-specific restriction enzyme A
LITQYAKTKNPPWNREELLLALELYMRNRKPPPSKTSREVESLSKELNRLRQHIGSRGSSSFRNTDGVYLKMTNFRSYDPDYTSQGKVGMRHGNKLDAVVWKEFFGKEGELFKASRAIREALKELPENSDADSEDDGFVEAAEGKLLTELHKRGERSVTLDAIASKLNELAPRHPIGKLQVIRTQLKRLKQRPGDKIFQYFDDV